MDINGKTVVYGIIGKPVSHSLSPVMHNAALQALGLNGVYVPFDADDIAAAVAGIRGLNIGGVSVTIPYKEAVLGVLDRIDPVAAKIGAVNTIRREADDTGEKRLLCGYNTDWLGAVRPLREKIDLQGKKAVILGAGGAARAIGFGLQEAGAEVLLCSRTESRGRRLASDLECDWHSLEKSGELEGDVLVNATSVGMTPDDRVSPVPADLLQRFGVVMDIVYAPRQTVLLRDAEAAGCTVVGGLEMLLHQGVAQFEMWTGRTAPVETMREALLAAVGGGR